MRVPVPAPPCSGEVLWIDRSQRTVREEEIEVQGGSGQASWRRRFVVVVARGTGDQVGTFTISRPAASRSPSDA